MPALTQVEGDLTLRRMHDLLALDGLTGLARVGGDVLVSQNRALDTAARDAFETFLGTIDVVGTATVSP
jgi:hypothetical protein